MKYERYKDVANVIEERWAWSLQNSLNHFTQFSYTFPKFSFKLQGKKICWANMFLMFYLEQIKYTKIYLATYNGNHYQNGNEKSNH